MRNVRIIKPIYAGVLELLKPGRITFIRSS